MTGRRSRGSSMLRGRPASRGMNAGALDGVALRERSKPPVLGAFERGGRSSVPREYGAELPGRFAPAGADIGGRGELATGNGRAPGAPDPCDEAELRGLGDEAGERASGVRAAGGGGAGFAEASVAAFFTGAAAASGFTDGTSAFGATLSVLATGCAGAVGAAAESAAAAAASSVARWRSRSTANARSASSWTRAAARARARASCSPTDKVLPVWD